MLSQTLSNLSNWIPYKIVFISFLNLTKLFKTREQVRQELADLSAAKPKPIEVIAQNESSLIITKSEWEQLKMLLKAQNFWIFIYDNVWQGGRTWQTFVRSKNGNENFRQTRIYNFWVKCVVFARNRKFAKLAQWNMQYIPCNSALLGQETLFLTQKSTFFAQRSPKSA